MPTYTVTARSNKFLGSRMVLSRGAYVVATFPSDTEGHEAADEAVAICNSAKTPEDRRAAEKLANQIADTFR